jgi:hypothetical protein
MSPWVPAVAGTNGKTGNRAVGEHQRIFRLRMIVRYSKPPLTPMNCPVIERAFGEHR